MPQPMDSAIWVAVFAVTYWADKRVSVKYRRLVSESMLQSGRCCGVCGKR
ncbi:MAG: hypothetical protein ACLUTE_09770 [Dorea longicatena]